MRAASAGAGCCGEVGSVEQALQLVAVGGPHPGDLGAQLRVGEVGAELGEVVGRRRRVVETPGAARPSTVGSALLIAVIGGGSLLLAAATTRWSALHTAALVAVVLLAVAFLVPTAVADSPKGAASGLVTTTQELGAAVGLTVLTTVGLLLATPTGPVTQLTSAAAAVVGALSVVAAMAAGRSAPVRDASPEAVGS